MCWPLWSLLLSVLLLFSPSSSAFVPLYHDGLMVVGRSKSSCTSSSLHANFLDNLFKNSVIAPAEKKKKQKEIPPPVVIDRDYRVAGLFLVAGVLLDSIPYVQFLLGLPVTLLGIVFLIQTYRVRFVFDEDNNLAIRIGNELKKSGENLVVGGENVWSCDSIVNYDFFPKGWIDNTNRLLFGLISLDIPILVYFKETQTDSATWNQGPGKSANDPEKIAAGQAVGGQVHFFPAVCNAKQIRSEFEKRQCGKILN